MIYFAVNAAIVLGVSFIVGSLTINLFKLQDKYFTFSMPIGFLVLMATLQIGFYFYTLIGATPTMYMKCLFVIFAFYISLGILKLNWIIDSIRKLFHNKLKICIALLLVGVSLYLFAYTDINFRLDDMNFYADFIPKRIYENEPIQIHYSYQALYTMLSAMLGLGKYFSLLNIEYNYLPLGFIQWVPAIITAVTLSFMIVDMYSFARATLKNKYLASIVWLMSVIIIYSDYWYNNFLHFGGTLRRLAIVYILLIFIKYIKNRHFMHVILLTILFGSYFAISSSGFFLDVILIYSYILYEMFNDKTGYIKNALIMMLYPVSFACVYHKVFIYLFGFIYLVCIILIIFKSDTKLEKLLNKIKYLILILPVLLCGVATYVFNLPSEELFNTMVEGRGFFDNVNKFDMIPDLFNLTTNLNITFNLLYWLTVLVLISYGIKHKDDIITFILIIVLVSFFNPISFKIVSSYITGVAYFRITDIFYNIIFLIYFVYVIKNVKYKQILPLSLSILIVMSGIKIKQFEVPNFNKTDDHNIMYRGSNFEINLIKTFEEEFLRKQKPEEFLLIEDKVYINVVSHIYGAQFYSDLNIINQLEDRYAYKIIDTDEFEQVFAKRYPGINLPEVNYDKACSLAKIRDTKYFIIDAQYNWELQTGLWPCTSVVLERDNYRILKSDFDYWEENLKLGYVKDYRDEIDNKHY